MNQPITPESLKAAFPAMPEETQAALLCTLAHLPEKNRISRPALIPALALLLALALCACAVAAARSGLLIALLGADQRASESLEAMVQTPVAVGTADGITISLSGAACDGAQLAYAFDAHNADPAHPALIVLEETIVDNHRIPGQFTATATADHLLWTPSIRLDLLPVQRNPSSGSVTADLPTPQSGEITCTAVFSILRPDGPLVVADAGMHEDLSGYDADVRAERADQRAAILAIDGLTVADAQHLDAREWARQGYAVFDMGGDFYDGSDADEAFRPLRKTGELALSFTIACVPGWAFAPDAPIPLEDCTAVVEQLLISPLSTRVALALVPQENTEAAAAALLAAHPRLALTDEAGAPLSYHAMDFLSDDSGRIQNEDGQWGCVYHLDMPGLSAYPAALRLFGGALVFPIQ